MIDHGDHRTHRIFVSHASADNDFVALFVARLRALLDEKYPNIYMVWCDRQGRPGPDGVWVDGMKPAQSWQDQIDRELEAANVFLVILSPGAVQSQWVREELRVARSRGNSIANEDGLLIIPVLLANCDMRDLRWLTLIQSINFVGWQPTGWAVEKDAWAQVESAVREPHPQFRSSDLFSPPFDVDLLPPLERLVGREDEVRQVITWLTNPSAPELTGLVGLVAATNGLGGVGKTALATEVAWRLWRQKAFPDGIAVVICRDRHGEESAQAMLRRALGRFAEDNKEPEARDWDTLRGAARRILGGKRALVILDNVESDLPVEKIIDPLRNAGAAVLVTSREPVFGVPADATLWIKLLPNNEALSLFALYLGRPLDALSVQERNAAQEIVNALGRHTLAIKLAAASAATLGFSLVEIVDELRRSPERAILLQGGNQTVLHVLASSVSALTPTEQRLFIALAAFDSGDIGRQAAQSVATALSDPDPDSSVNRLLSMRLADNDYLEALPGGDLVDRARLRLHPLVRSYAHKLFVEQRDGVIWTAAFAEQAEFAVELWYAIYTNEDISLALAPDEANIAAALELAHFRSAQRAPDDLPELLQLATICQGAGGFWVSTGRLGVAQRWLSVGMLAAEQLVLTEHVRNAGRLYANIEMYYGQALLDAGDLQAAEDKFTHNLNYWRHVADQRKVAEALNYLGMVAFARIEQLIPSNAATRTVIRNYLEQAEKYFLDCLKILGQDNVPNLKATIHNSLGNVAYKREQLEEADSYLDQAEAYYQQSLAFLTEMDEPGAGARVLEARILNNLGNVAYRRKAWPKVEDHYRRSLDMLRQIGDRVSEAKVLNNLGRLLIEHLDQQRLGCQHLTESANLYDTVGLKKEAKQTRDWAGKHGCE